jgi:hypothetical protein
MTGNDECCLPPDPIPIPAIPVPALHSRPAQAAQSSALRNPAFAPLKGKEKSEAGLSVAKPSFETEFQKYGEILDGKMLSNIPIDKKFHDE